MQLFLEVANDAGDGSCAGRGGPVVGDYSWSPRALAWLGAGQSRLLAALQ